MLQFNSFSINQTKPIAWYTSWFSSATASYFTDSSESGRFIHYSLPLPRKITSKEDVIEEPVVPYKNKPLPCKDFNLSSSSFLEAVWNWLHSILKERYLGKNTAISSFSAFNINWCSTTKIYGGFSNMWLESKLLYSTGDNAFALNQGGLSCFGKFVSICPIQILWKGFVL